MDDFKSKIEEYKEKVQASMVKAVADTARAIAENAQKNTTNELAGAISVENGDNGLSAVISSNSPNAVLTEYGIAKHDVKNHKPKHLHQQGGVKGHQEVDKNLSKPFLNPAFEEQRPIFLDALQKIFI